MRVIPFPAYAEADGELVARWSECVADEEYADNWDGVSACWKRARAERQALRKRELDAQAAYLKAVEAEADARFAAFVAAQAAEVAAFEAEHGTLDVDECEVCGDVKIAGEACARCKGDG